MIAVTAACTAGLLVPAVAEHKSLATGAFEVTHALVLPGPPEEIYDAITGDVSGWWDHSFSEKPARLFIEARPGGGFWEYFDSLGAGGVRHATVTSAERGKLLRFEGPLGLGGNALLMVHTYAFEAIGDGKTRLTLTVRASGQMETSWADAVDRAWHHFLFERFKPWVEAGRHRQR
jgi:uncharacterized protein YndB with AHSA1/START domain